MKWATGEVIGLFTDEQGEWVKVRCGQRVHDVLAHDPDLRVGASDNMLIPADKIKELREAAMESPDIAKLLQTVDRLQRALNDEGKS